MQHVITATRRTQRSRNVLFATKLFLFWLMLASVLTGCYESPYRFSSLETSDETESTTLWPSRNFDAAELDAVLTTPAQGDAAQTNAVPTEHNAYVCACRALVPIGCVNNFQCGFVGTGTQVTDDGRYCDLGTREAKVCFNGMRRPPGSLLDLEYDCSGRVRTAALLGLRFAFSTCRQGASHCQIKLACTAVDVNNRVRTTAVNVCNGSSCQPQEPLNYNLNNARTATFVPEELQLLCSEQEENVSVEQQRVCRQVEF